MLRVLFLTFCLLTSFSVSAQTEKDVKIPWEGSRKLSWDDFQGPPDEVLVKDSMLAAAAIELTYTYKSYDTGEVFDFVIINRFNPSVAWSVDKTDMFLLEHEQLHFDIAEVVARQMRKGIECFEKEGISDWESHKEFLDKKYQLFRNLTAKYDEETDHGRRPGVQNEWKARIAKELESLSEYAARVDDQ